MSEALTVPPKHGHRSLLYSEVDTDLDSLRADVACFDEVVDAFGAVPRLRILDAGTEALVLRPTSAKPSFESPVRHRLHLQ